ncbi:MAG TPA: hypothetical protein VNW92_04625 [Polyangiaceae bacterium]|nr:hypothetical protein [Polyangiaceae bacterium]
MNAGDREAIVDTFAECALVVDELQEYWNRQAIADWVNRLVVAPRLSLDVRSATYNGEHTVVRAVVDGDFDKRGLPEPLIVSFYFSAHEGKLVQLLILRNEPTLTSPE